MFWLSNVHEVLSFALLAKDWYNIQKEDELGRLLETFRHDLESLQFDIYHAWMRALKGKLTGIMLPGLIVPPAFQFNIEGILGLFDQIYNALRGYFIEELVITRVVNELLKLVGDMAFNDLL